MLTTEDEYKAVQRGQFIIPLLVYLNGAARPPARHAVGGDGF